MWAVSASLPECGPATGLYQLGTIVWTGTVGSADFVIPDAPPGDYYVNEQLPGWVPPCMPIGPLTITNVPDTALASSATPSPASTLIVLAAVVGGLLTLCVARRRPGPGSA